MKVGRQVDRKGDRTIADQLLHKTVRAAFFL